MRSLRHEPVVHTQADRDLASAQWLLSAVPAVQERRARQEWASDGVALLRCGVLFSAVRIPARYLHAAAGADDASAVAAHVADVLHGGPVFCDSNAWWYYALTPPSAAARRWRIPGVTCLGKDSYLGVPALGRKSRTRYSRVHWVVPMGGPGILCEPQAVLILAAKGHYHASAEEAGR